MWDLFEFGYLKKKLVIGITPCAVDKTIHCGPGGMSYL